MGKDRTTSTGDSRLPDPSGSDDFERISSYLDGSPAAFQEMDDWIRREIAARYPVLRMQIDDVCQAVHAKLVSNFRAGKFEGRSSLRTYVTGVAHHTAVDTIRALYRDRAVFSRDEAHEEPAAPGNPYRSLQRLEDGRLYYQALQRSPEACREMWRLVLLEKLSYETIAARLAIPEGTVKSRMWYCRRKLMDLLGRMQGGRTR